MFRLATNIARVCAESSFTLEELKEILDSEVAPICSRNLLSIAGEWAGFDEEWLASSIKNNILSKKSIVKKILSPLKNFGFNTYIRIHWIKIKPIIVQNRITAQQVT